MLRPDPGAMSASSSGVQRCERHWRVPTLLKSPRAPLARVLLRIPLAVYRLGLGQVLGHEFLALEHVGRRSGRIHETVLKVLRYDASSHECIVASAWGKQTDWYRNVQAQAPLSVCCGGDWYVPQMRTVPAEEAYAVFEEWTRRERWFADLMLAQIGLSWNVPESDRRSLVARFPFVAFRPNSKAQPNALVA